MYVTKLTLFVGILFLALGLIQWHLHATDGWIGEDWDNNKQENLYYHLLAPVSALCLFVIPILMALGI